MIAKYIQKGDFIDYTPVAAVSAGDVVALGNNRFGIAPIDIAAGELGALQVVGVFELPKAAGVIAIGALVFWTGGTTNSVGTTPVSNGYIGRAYAAAADADTTVLVQINATNIGAWTLEPAAEPAAATVTAPTTSTITGTDYTGQPAIIKAAIEQNDANIDALKACLDALIAALKTGGFLE